MIDLDKIEGFEWDDGNLDKNWIRHRVSNAECEELFFNTPLVVMDDRKHSIEEIRYFALGQTNLNRRLFVAFTIRRNRIRIISARDMSKNERIIYEKNP